jgi:peptide/nickel transport system substrate-binding protein
MAVVAACSGGDHETSSSSRLTSASALDFHHQAPAAPIPGASRGGVVTAFASDMPTSLDPTAAYTPATGAILGSLVERSLTQYVYDPASREMVLVPDIATDTGIPNADFTSWTFTVRSGVRFENGTEVTAADVAYGIERSLDHKDFPSGAPYSKEYFLDGHTYRGPSLSGTDYAGVVVKGDRLTIKMARPFPDMPYYAALPAIGPIPQLGSSPAVYARHPVSTGPYRVAAFMPGKSLTLVRNAYWDPDTDPVRHAYPDRWRILLSTSAAHADAIILGTSAVGQTALSLDSVDSADYAKAEASGQVAVGPRLCTHMLFPDNRKITDVRVREAIGYAYPYRKMARASGFIPGVTQLYGSSELPPGFPGRQQYDVVRPGRTRPDKARALLEAAGYPPGKYPLSFVYDASDPADVSYKSLLARGLTAGGFSVTPFRTSSPTESSAVDRDPHAPINLRRDDGGWCTDWPSGNGMLAPVFGSHGSANVEFFSEPSVDEALARISGLPIDQQSAQWGLLDKTITTKYYPVVVTDYGRAAKPFGKRIGGFVNDGVSGEPTLQDIYVRR